MTDTVSDISSDGKQELSLYKRDISEYMRQYYTANKERIAATSKRNYEAKKEKLLEKIDCPCGGRYNRPNRSGHFKTHIHQRYESQQAERAEQKNNSSGSSSGSNNS